MTKRETKSLDNAIISEETFTYDAAGNITDAPDTCFAYDNGLEIKFDMKMENLVMCFGISLIGVLRMVPTGYAGRCSRVLKVRGVS